MRRPGETDRQICTKIAARVISASSPEMLPDCFEGRLSREDKRRSAETLPNPAKNTAAIGIWTPQDEPGGTAYVRSANLDREFLWSDMNRIEPKAGGKRVILLGESVARGYFYDPAFNPAKALATILGSVLGPDAIEVVDLARTDQLFDGLLNLAQSAIALRPDAYIVFAGNNWHPLTGFADIPAEELAPVLKWTRQWKSVAQIIETRMREAVASLMRALGGIASNHKIPIFFVLPEFNLVDWRTEFAEPGLVENPAGMQRWRALRKLAERALENGDASECARLAKDMLQLAGETDIVSLELLARNALLQKMHGDARKLLEQARDVSLSLPAIRSPRCYAVIQETLRAASAREGIFLIDLPHRFAEHLGGDLPDRRLFHDYCHLTIEGICVAMSSVAEQILPRLGLPAIPWRQLLETRIVLEPQVIAKAHFLAAVHNATWGQGPEIVRHHCAEAVRVCPALATVFELYLDGHVRRPPALLCRSLVQLLANDDAQLFNYFAAGLSTREKDLNLVLVDAMLDVLKPLRPGIDVAIRGLMVKERSLQEGRENLLDPAYSSESAGAYGFRSQSRCGFYEALEIESRFRFVCEGPGPLELRAVLRVPQLPSSAEVFFLLNGRELLRASSVSCKWQSVYIHIPATLVNTGLNSITIQWPEAWQSWEDRAFDIAERFEHEVPGTVFYVYGQIHSLWIVNDKARWEVAVADAAMMPA